MFGISVAKQSIIDNPFKLTRMVNYVRSLLVLVFAASIAGCATNPVTGKKQVALISEAQEIAMGQEADPQIVAQFGIYPDSSLQRYMNDMGQRMARVSHRPNLNYTFRVVDSDVINAFAVPGGYVYFTRGIMAHFNNEAQFAGVLGHEIGHITYRHTVSQQSRQMLSQIGLIGAMIAKPELGQFAEQASQGLQLLMLKYDRNAESQSDEVGVEYSSKIGYDAREMAKFFTTLKRQQEKSGQELPEFLSTHPDPGNRQVTVNKLALEYQKVHNITNPQINRNSYLNRINNIVYGEDPRQGFRENNVFYHPDLKFQFNTPAGWRYNNSPTQVQFAPQDGNALLFMTAGQGASLQQAAQNLVQQASIQVSESKELSVNGLPALALVGQQVQQNQQTGQSQVATSVMAYFIQYNNLIYQFVGVSAPQNFNSFAGTFQNTMQSFRQLTDQRIINIKPERVAIKTVNSNTTLQQALQSLGVPSNRLEEMSVLNGMMLTDNVQKGTLIKIVDRK